MNELYEQIAFHVNSIWEKRFYALAVAWLLCLVGWVMVAAMPKTYQSSARIFIDTSNILRPLLRGLAVEADINAEIEVVKQTLTSRSNLASVARMTDLDITATTPSQMEGLLHRLKSGTRIRSEGRRVISISFVDADPVRARDIVEALLTSFVEINLGYSRENIDAARQFLDTQILSYERQLEQAENRLVKFKQEKSSKLPRIGAIQSRLDNSKNELIETEALIRKAVSDRDVLREQLRTGIHSKPGVDPKISKLEDSLQEMLTGYTDRYPEVIALRRKLDALRNSETNEAELIENTEGPPSDTDNILPSADQASPEYELIKFQLVQQEGEINFYKSKANRIKKSIRNLEDLMALVPEVEAERTKLNRDYDVLKGKFAELLSRREQANISLEREIRAEKVKFRVVDPPGVPRSPTGPSRSFLLTVVLVFGVGSGIAFALFLGLVNDTFSNPTQLKEAFALPIVGVISIIDTFREHSRRVARNSLFIASFSLLFATYGTALIVEKHVGLGTSVKRVTTSSDWTATATEELLSVFNRAFGRM
ncbi:MAG: hypothetical protein O7I42_00715 [Alphaproteobacteria bacterium]|nr:hypothetical protein [Alphaproteobacteria bacterium]